MSRMIWPTNPPDLRTAQLLHQSGQFDRAAHIYRDILARNPGNSDALHGLGLLEARAGHFESAKSLIARSLELQPANMQFRQNYASILFEDGDHEFALQVCNQALRSQSTNTYLLYLSAVALLKLKRLAESLQRFDKLLKVQPDHLHGINERGCVLAELKEYDKAVAAFDKAVSLNPKFAEAHLNKGNLFGQLNRYEQAQSSFENTLALNPGLARAWSGLGIILGKRSLFGKALVAFDEALALEPNLTEAWLGRGNVFCDLRRSEQAFAAYNKALSLKPDLSEAWLGRGNMFRELNRFEEALAEYEKALAVQPDYAQAHYNEGLLRLALGEMERGWRKCEYRWETQQYRAWKRNFLRPLWLGDVDIKDKTILLHAEQGLGDTLLASRYVPKVAALGANVILEVQPPLKSLLRDLEGISKLICRGEAIPHFDVHCPLMSLPLAFKTIPKSIPNTVPYITVPKDAVAKWALRIRAPVDLKVGIAWAGNPGFSKDRDRSVLLKNILPVTRIGGIKYFSLQKDLRDGDDEILNSNPEIVRLDKEINDFQDTAAIMMSLDLVLSSDTSIVNLAGALGRPVWVLLPFISDWRWLLERDDALWYPTARLFRQPRIGDWSTVVDNVCTSLKRLVDQRSSPSPVPV